MKEQKLKEIELLNGQTGLSPEEEKLRIMGLDLSTWEDRSCEDRERSLQRLNSGGELALDPSEEAQEVSISELPRSEDTAPRSPLHSVSVRDELGIPSAWLVPNQRCWLASADVTLRLD